LTKTFEGILKKRENSLEPALGKRNETMRVAKWCNGVWGCGMKRNEVITEWR